MKSMLEARQNPSCGTGTQTSRNASLGTTNQDLLWIPRIPLWSSVVWVLGAQTGRKGLCLQVLLSRNCFPSPCQVVQQENKSHGIPCPARSAQPQTPETATNFKGSRTTPGTQKERRDFYCTQGRNPFSVTERSQGKSCGFPPEEAGQKEAQPPPKRPKEQHILKMQIKIISANKAQL